MILTTLQTLNIQRQDNFETNERTNFRLRNSSTQVVFGLLHGGLRL
jgi:hypothetical protein